MMDSSDEKYHYSKRGVTGARVGQAVSDILSKEQPDYTVADILEGFGMKFAIELEKTIENNLSKYKSPFYVFALTKKEFWADNVVRNWFIARQTPPYALEMMIAYPGYTKTLYVINSAKGDLKVAWSIPGIEECKSILKTPNTFSPDLVQWIQDCFASKLELDDYDYLFRK